MSSTARLRPDAFTVFLFHGVVEEHTHPVRNYLRKHIDRKAFAACLAELKAAGHPLGMEDIVDLHLHGGELPPRAFVVTFDDGFANNHSIAAPMLLDHGIPATFYVTTQFVDENAMSWIDRIEYCVEEAGRGTVRLPWDAHPRAFDGPGQAGAVLDDIRLNVKRSPELDVEDLVGSLFRDLGIPEIKAGEDPLDRKMTWDQVAELHAEPSFTVGGHTHTHAIMSFLTPPELDREIDTSLELLRERAGVGPRHYSYPEGQAHCYSEAVIQALKRRGVVCCPTAVDGANTPGTDLFHLKRVMVA